MVVAHNLLAANTNRQLGIVTGNKKKSTERLASGYRINRSADDAAGLSISEKMRWQVRGLNKASNNCNAGVDFCKVAEGAMNEVSSMLNRMKELSVQAANDTYTDTDRQAIQCELDQISREIDRIDETTEYNTLKVFSWERNKITSQGDDVNGWSEIHREVITVEGIKYGITNVLGETNVYGGNQSDQVKLNSPVQFTGGTWVSTGKDKYTINKKLDDLNKIYEEWGINPSSTGIGYANPTAISEFMRGSNNTNDIHLDYEAQGMRVTFKYDSNVKTSDTTYPVSRIQVERGVYTTDPVSGNLVFSNGTLLKTYSFVQKNNNSAAGTKGEIYGQTYGSAWMDFSGLDSGDFDLRSLYGEGFNTQCATCSRPYSVRFTGDTCDKYTTDGLNVNYSFDSGTAKCLTINISDCTSGADIVKHIVSAANAVNHFVDHFQQYAYNTADPSKIYIYDNRENQVNGGRSKFIPTALTTDGKQIVKETVIYHPGSGTKTSYSDRDLWIQSGSTNKSGFFIKKPRCNSTFLGVSGLGVMDFDDASAAIATVDSAIEILNDQRTMMGAQQNRLEITVNVDDNTAENTDAAESRIRDTDMAEEMVNFSKHNILEQAGQSMLAQANQSTQGILSLIQ